MSKELKQFVLQLSILTLAAAGIGSLVFVFVFPEYYFPAYPFSFVVFFAVSLLSHIGLIKALQKSPTKFNSSFMLLFFLKILIYTAFAAVVLIISEENKKPFAVVLLAQYLIYTFFDVRQMLVCIRNYKE